MIEAYLTPHNLAVFGAGLVLGALAVVIINLSAKGRARKIAEEIFNESETRKLEELDRIIDGIRDSFGALSHEALSRNSEQFMRLAGESLSKQAELGGKELENKKGMIDQTLAVIRQELERTQTRIIAFEKDREQKYGELASQLGIAAERTAELQATTSRLREALANTKRRGQWGERMAEDILAFIGFKEGVNYHRQKMLAASSAIPDYTFILPDGLKVNMDVKFPLDNYVKFLEAESDAEKSALKSQFIKDVRARVRDVTRREYINPEDNTIDYVIVFIPNEQIYSFVQEHDALILDEALRSKVILCSPITLYAVLAVIRQSVDNFNLKRTTGDILSLYNEFGKQWRAYVECYEKLGKKIADVQSEYDNLKGTRTNMVERPLRKIEALRESQGISGEEPPARHVLKPGDE
ncbi:MAG TPA: DNA recombination protein RmuC [Thermodesulfobacteriota bacterium]|nr:DNA recombination protein RmuC [Thermodesulfobacteriota bacterium]